jgi:hypothetical protein
MSGLILDAGALTRPLSSEGERRLAAALSAGRALAGRMARHARENHPWRSRTGLAARSIGADAGRNGARIVIRLTGGAPYSAALETGYGGRYAVLWPTARAFTPEFLRIAKGEGA